MGVYFSTLKEIIKKNLRIISNSQVICISYKRVNMAQWVKIHSLKAWELGFNV